VKKKGRRRQPPPKRRQKKERSRRRTRPTNAIKKSQSLPINVLSPDKITQTATVERDELAKIPRWANAFDKTISQEPLLVESGEPSDSYYLVEFRRDTRTTGLMTINAVSGEPQEIAGIGADPTDRTLGLFKFYHRGEIPPLLDNRVILTNPSRRITIKAENLNVQPNLYWVPCDQSLEAVQPFYLVDHVTEGASDRLYVRVDGEVFPTITRLGRGQ
jgi:hypothetical protein